MLLLFLSIDPIRRITPRLRNIINIIVYTKIVFNLMSVAIISLSFMICVESISELGRDKVMVENVLIDNMKCQTF